MPTASLPDNPNIEQLKGNAKVLRDLVRAGATGAIELVREHHPRSDDILAGTGPAPAFKLADAQLTLARHYGYSSWPNLRDHVNLINELSRSPHQQPVGGELVDDAARADEFLRLACLNYGNDQPERRRAAERLLEQYPYLAGWSIHTAAATGDVQAATEILRTDRGAARREGGPFRWEPLLYLTYSRIVIAGRGRDAVSVARLLLDHGADPNSGYLWEGLPSPFTAVTGVFGRGEQGAPPHQDELALARLLLDAGAEANDSQTIYNRGLGDFARDDTDFLELLLDHGLGRGDGGPWRRLLINEHQTPTEIAADALQHAAEAGLTQRIRLLLSRGVDPNIRGTHPGFDTRTPYEGAILRGNVEIAALLADAGAETSGVDSVSRFVGACLANDRAAVSAAIATDPDVLDRALDTHSGLIAAAAEFGRIDSISLLVSLGFDVNACPRVTALHEAAVRGNLAMVKLLLASGADPTIVDHSYNSTARGWAEHSGQIDMVAYFDSLP